MQGAIEIDPYGGSKIAVKEREKLHPLCHQYDCHDNRHHNQTGIEEKLE